MKYSLKIRRRMAALLDQTVAHYNSKNRSVAQLSPDRVPNCYYVPVDPECSEGCAIGRLLPEKHVRQIMAAGCNSLSVRSLFSHFRTNDIGIPKVFSGIPLSFLFKLQNLHDKGKYWNEDGISNLGTGHVTAMRDDFDLNGI